MPVRLAVISEHGPPPTTPPAATLVKTADPSTVRSAGDTVTYSFRITNTGNVALTDVTVNEGAFNGTGSLSAVDCPPAAASLLPGQVVTCTATYQVTAGDLGASALVNTATATGTPPSGDPITAIGVVTCSSGGMNSSLVTESAIGAPVGSVRPQPPAASAEVGNGPA